ncbi:RNA polymerase sigma factor SigI [Bacillaceae bacterium S4-13-58]
MISRLFQKRIDNSLEEQVIAAQNGQSDITNHLLEKYRPFIAKTVSEVCKRFIDPNHDDEFSIGLIAFHEAIDAYSSEKGSSFLSFAKLVIKRKVIDYIRSEKKKVAVASIDHFYEDEDYSENPEEVKAANEQYRLQMEAMHRQEEIKDYQIKLKRYQLSFEELTKISPKHKDARESAIKVAKLLYQEESLRNYVFDKKKLPIKDLEAKVDVSKKTLERNRKYIIAIFIILCEDYLYLKDYLRGVG